MPYTFMHLGDGLQIMEIAPQTDAFLVVIQKEYIMSLCMTPIGLNLSIPHGRKIGMNLNGLWLYATIGKLNGQIS